MNDACPSAARLTEFAQTPLQEENVDIAVHILQCKDCAKKLSLMNQIILSHCEVTQDEWDKISETRTDRQIQLPPRQAFSSVHFPVHIIRKNSQYFHKPSVPEILPHSA